MVTDLTYLTGMSGGNPDIVKEMITIFNEQTEEYIVEIKKLLDEKNYNQLGKLAHKAKSSVAIMGMTDLAADLKTLELLTKDNLETETYADYVEKFIVQCKIAMEELKKVYSSL